MSRKRISRKELRERIAKCKAEMEGVVGVVRSNKGWELRGLVKLLVDSMSQERARQHWKNSGKEIGRMGKEWWKP